MCRSIRPLFNFDPPASPDEIQAASLQFVRKVSGMTKPSSTNQAAFDRAVADVSGALERLLGDLVTTAAPRDREVVARQARERSARRFPDRRTVATVEG